MFNENNIPPFSVQNFNVVTTCEFSDYTQICCLFHCSCKTGPVLPVASEITCIKKDIKTYNFRIRSGMC